MTSILSFPIDKAKLAWLDFSAKNQDLHSLNPDDTKAFTSYVFGLIDEQNAQLGIGGWLEDRRIYNTREQFNLGKSRSIHLGVDIWMPAGTPLFCPEDCQIHSFANNEGFGNYGPTIILKSLREELYYLFGHLSLESLEGKLKGQTLKEGETFAEIGNYPINGDWPPHLHFQVMNNLFGKEGDFPGVCARNELKVFEKVCLCPYPFLGISAPRDV
ncbi:peptidoglycan DD-metalloendopeptidase family protein [Jiulongibacter sediminis]|uniref:M23ase beta-sheet core domain-containing protein n=1 Tax=Jiulongibacter sediminis TaxID=1605367 RepID=A0A0P7C6R8_9BACT|nr:peptidoglycan DD-metalloendopeptidase family protein [Jiulongibacter sediminis]KPM50041.1 hypothetical protein AFM12_05715 [Jiulongibacter sediminis]